MSFGRRVASRHAENNGLPRRRQLDRPTRGRCAALRTTKRLCRGLKEPYAPQKVGAEHPGSRPGLFGTDFTDCPLAALRYAQGRKGVLLVVEVPARDEVGPLRVTTSSGGSPTRARSA
jgi:hypothetical protein